MQIHNAKDKNRTWRVMWGVLLSLMLLVVLTACSDKNNSSADEGVKDEQQNAMQSSATVILEDSDLVIPVADITEKAAFYPVEVEGTRMEIIAVKAPDGTIRTAFNTCQVCYDSGRGYYKQSGDKLVCQNCGNQFNMDRVEVEAGGCNPWPIFAEDKNVTDDSITISYEFLKESQEIFANWKQSY
ncbi:DUF2318 domain-containing protein [Aminipila sp.]|uniref:DUF2318 domain-containing protein n=1 Tax=Aminipila sp. TaxID=2060095 RepID=UPI00289C2AE2|nr:DUF2318 domain-containing protein [Aminipila sp.]